MSSLMIINYWHHQLMWNTIVRSRFIELGKVEKTEDDQCCPMGLKTGLNQIFSSRQFNILYFRCSDSRGNTCYHQWSHVGYVLCKTWWYYWETVLQNIWGENYLLPLAESCEGTKLSWCNSPLANTSLQTWKMWTT